MTEFVDIEYSHSDPFHKFDIIFPRSHPLIVSSLICFVHGGAWRSEDKADHRQLATRLVHATNLPVALPNYRLTSKDPSSPYHNLNYPAHAQDILQFLSFVIAWKGPDGQAPTSPTKLYLVGHSCSAHMLASIILDSSSVSPSLTPSISLLQTVQAVIMSEGIYDIDLLLNKFPGYADWFIHNTFSPSPSYAEFSTTDYSLRSESSHIRWLILHSHADTLVDVPQSEAMYKHLCALYGPIDNSPDSHVTANFEHLKEEHNDIPRGTEYPRIIGNFISK